MTKRNAIVFCCCGLAAAIFAVTDTPAAAETPANQVMTSCGIVEGSADTATAIRTFKGVPFAAAPVGDLRWRPPQPCKGWTGVRMATEYAARPMQILVSGDKHSRGAAMSEDCLYLNVWTPAKTGKEPLPVFVYFYGGGFVCGDSAEPRCDGAAMARKGIVAVTVNYRLGIFGFMAHPDLTKESPQHASGNYGLLDQAAALQWVQKNIAAFGGDPKRVTIGGESAGSVSVCAQMASPLSRKLIAGAIGESGAMFGKSLEVLPLDQAEKIGTAFGGEQSADSISELRAIPAEKLLDACRSNPFRFGLTIDGYFLPKSTLEIYSAGEQAHVPLLVGWNAAEIPGASLLGRQPSTMEGFARAVKAIYGDRTDDALRVYHASTDAEVNEVATALAADLFVAHGTWKWSDLQGKTSGKPVYRYLFARSRPGENSAFHAIEIEYALGNLDSNKGFKWTDDDRKVSATMLDYFANFVKSGDPNGTGLPAWPAINNGSVSKVMRLDAESSAEPEQHRDRYLFLDAVELAQPRKDS